MDGVAEIETAWGIRQVSAGSSLALGGGQWCRIRPVPTVRMWTLYADEMFLRSQMSWFLPKKERVLAGAHPHDWDGSPLVLEAGIAMLRQIEPLWRQLSVLRDGSGSPETVAVRAVELFARSVEVALPVFVVPASPADPTRAHAPIRGRLTETSAIGQVGRAVRLLRLRMAEPWTVAKVAHDVSLSRSHLTRLFIAQTGVAPMRFLIEVRRTEFTRLIEETDLSIAEAARAVGWSDPRTASAWFAKRYGMLPSQYRLTPHPHRAAAENAADLTARPRL